uniref:CoA-transferase n=1 Tax=OCS116 cluster bacterium TaxID=2030921 RepID=A0A2A4Z0V4_9PROT
MSKKIFSDLKVVDFTWAAAGPIATKQFADNGATVVKVESFKHPDSIRLGGPFTDDKPGINRSGFFADFHSSKLSIGVDMNHEDALEIIRPLIEWADVVAESFRPGIMKKWGLDYDSLRKINPRIIMLSSSLYGADGPWSKHPGYGAQGAALAGIQHMTGWLDMPPAVPKGAYSDSVSPRYALSAVVAALIQRERTGMGQYVEMSQIEATAQLVAPQLLELQLTGKEAQRSGNIKECALLHSVFRCKGDERWIAIEIETEKQWNALTTLFDDVEALNTARKKGREELETKVEELTKLLDPFVLMTACHKVGVPAGVAYRGSDLLEDPILKARNHFWPLDHKEMGTLKYNGPAYRFDKTPSELRFASPLLGEHTDQVLTEILNFTSDDLVRFRDSGLLQ